MDSQVLFLLKEGMDVPFWSYGFRVTKGYLINNFSPDYHQVLMRNADQAKREGKVYIHFPEEGKCIPVPIQDLW